MSVDKELYKKRKENNLCTKCGKYASLNKTLCLYHLNKASKNQQAMLSRRKNSGLCYKCGNKLTNGRKTCNNCLDRRFVKPREKIWKHWTTRKNRGLCVACGLPNSTTNKWCEKCSRKYRKTESITRKSRISRGLCGDCGKRLLAKNSKTRCIICVYNRKMWYASSDFRIRHIQKYRSIRDRVIKHYGGVCACCGESERTFLAIDHIEGNGNTHRKKLNKWGSSFDKWLIDQNFPDGFQILCHNCNMSKYLSGGTCAHKLVRFGV